MDVVVTGARGFIGRRVVAAARAAGHQVHEVVRVDPWDRVAGLLRSADAVVHLAGVNRPKNPAEFVAGNAELTARIVGAVDAARRPIVVFASSTQTELDNPYGRSKLAAEAALDALAERGGRAVVFRLPNVFGPGARPNYNSAVATFAHNAANGIPLNVNDASRPLTLVYVHDVADAMLSVLRGPPPVGTAERRAVSPEYKTTVGAVADAMHAYAASRERYSFPDVSTPLARRLFATFQSYLPEDRFSYDLRQHSDARGVLAEFLKGDSGGQIFVSRTNPGVTRGNHYHHTKTEKFFVIEGDALIRFRRTDGSGEILTYRVCGREFRVVDIPPDYTHSIENVGSTELIVLFWASEAFDPQHPDTTTLNVLT